VAHSEKDKLVLKKLLKDLYSLISRTRKIQLLLLLFLFVISSIAETVNLAVIAPYLYFLTNPEDFFNYKLVEKIFLLLDLNQSSTSIFLFLTIGVIAFTLIAGSIRLLNLWLVNKISFGIGSDIGCLGYKNIIYQEYSYHLSANSNNLIATLSNDLNVVIVNLISPIIQLLSSLILVFAISIVLLVFSTIPTLLTIFAIMLSYSFFILNSKPRLKLNSQIQTKNNRSQIKLLQDGLGFIRNIILNNNQEFFLRKYTKHDKAFRKAQAESGLLSTYTKLILEPSVISLIAISGYLMAISGKSNQIIPALGIFAFGAQKILPFTQRVYEGWATSTASTKNLANVLDLFSKNKKLNEYKELDKNFKLSKINLKNISFSYKKNIKILKSISLEIKSGECIGLIGKTGSGKSTLIDIINTLLVPTTGTISINEKNIHKKDNLREKNSFRNIISYVPQNIYLSNDNILSNVALGIPNDEIDYERVKSAIKLSQAYNFINLLPDKLYTFIGERGIQLSGGEKQRIGIARALYKNSQVLILDEATNALDELTEKKVINSILSRPNPPLIIMIAHRLNTLKNCDFIYEIDKGTLKNKWTGKEFYINN